MELIRVQRLMKSWCGINVRGMASSDPHDAGKITILNRISVFTSQALIY